MNKHKPKAVPTFTAPQPTADPTTHEPNTHAQKQPVQIPQNETANLFLSENITNALNDGGVPEKIHKSVIMFLRLIAIGQNFEDAAIKSGISRSMMIITITQYPILQKIVNDITDMKMSLSMIDLISMLEDLKQLDQNTSTNAPMFEVDKKLRIIREAAGICKTVITAHQRNKELEIKKIKGGIDQMGGTSITKDIRTTKNKANQ